LIQIARLKAKRGVVNDGHRAGDVIKTAGVFPHFLLAFAVLDPTLGIGAWLLFSRSDRPRLDAGAIAPIQ
jgi:hypothetical protein